MLRKFLVLGGKFESRFGVKIGDFPMGNDFVFFWNAGMTFINNKSTESVHDGQWDALIEEAYLKCNKLFEDDERTMMCECIDKDSDGIENWSVTMWQTIAGVMVCGDKRWSGYGFEVFNDVHDAFCEYRRLINSLNGY